MILFIENDRKNQFIGKSALSLGNVFNAFDRHLNGLKMAKHCQTAG